MEQAQAGEVLHPAESAVDLGSRVRCHSHIGEQNRTSGEGVSRAGVVLVDGSASSMGLWNKIALATVSNGEVGRKAPDQMFRIKDLKKAYLWYDERQ